MKNLYILGVLLEIKKSKRKDSYRFWGAVFVILIIIFTGAYYAVRIYN